MLRTEAVDQYKRCQDSFLAGFRRIKDDVGSITAQVKAIETAIASAKGEDLAGIADPEEVAEWEALHKQITEAMAPYAAMIAQLLGG